MPRFFTLEQAQAMIPEVDRTLRAAQVAVRALRGAGAEIAAHSQRAQFLGGVSGSPARLATLASLRVHATHQLQALTQRLEELGVQIKDLDSGLVDFPTLYRDQEVLLCWRMGESGISFWHDLHSGFRGRAPIDRDFVDHNRGDEPI
jgi:hypothetical protein